MKKNNLIFVGIIVVVYLGISFFISFLININKMYIVFPDNINIKYEGKWKIFQDEKTLNNLYQIVDSGDLIKKSKLSKKDDTVYASDTSLEDDIIAYRGSKITNIVYQHDDELTETDYQYLSNSLYKKNISIDVKQIITKKYNIDLNDDRVDETIYVVSNNYNTDLGKLFSGILLKNTNEWIEFNEFESEYKSYVPCIYFVDLYKDHLADMIIKNVYSSLIGQDVKLISFKDDLSHKILFEDKLVEEGNK
ncbi:MAG: hypothetical protein MR388_01940 [Tenericutes bacterium]|nr:hypothetical protein [Mycoplasmatota bacterium]